MKSAIQILGADLQRCHEEGRTAAAADRPIDACAYRSHGKRAAWLQGWHQGQIDKALPPLCTVIERVSLPAFQKLRAAVGAFIQFAPGWHREKHDLAHWFDAEDRRSVCGRRRFDLCWKPADAEAERCPRCLENIALRSAPLPPISPERRAELRQQLEALMGRT